jgi:ABC-type polysaccharide/polyol phosphate transport system ATPase subunit
MSSTRAANGLSAPPGSKVSDPIAVEASGISKYYPLGKSQWTRLRQMFSHSGHPESLPPGDGLWALHDVSFKVRKGEALGIIGTNGSGKSTLLQIIAGILRPASGTVTVDGRLSALLELGSGFAPEFSGRENVFLNAAILGLPPEETRRKFDAIENFAGIGEFIDQPIRTYSTGMVLRLAFAVAVHVEPEILIVDEALAVGDIAFRQRCMRRIHELRAAGVTILFVSHDTGDVKALCEKCLWLDGGKVRGLGEADEIVARYLAATLAPEIAIEPKIPQGRQAVKSAAPVHVPSQQAMVQPVEAGLRYGNGAGEVLGGSLTSAGGASPDEIQGGGIVILRVHVRAVRPLDSPIVGFLVRNRKGETIFGSNSARENHPLPAMAPGETQMVDFHLTMPPLLPDQYSVSIAIANGSLAQFAIGDYIEDAIPFRLAGGSRPVTGYMELPCLAVALHRG